MPTIHQLRETLRSTLRDHAGTLVLLPLAVYFAWTKEAFFWLDAINLLIHEAGHTFMRPFGRFIMFAGGTIFQIGVPLIFVWSAVRFGNAFGAQVSLLWTGQNCIHVSVYAGDAQTRHLPLITNDPMTHDWWNMLRMVDLLPYDGIVAGLFYTFGLVCFAVIAWVPTRLW
ncbi:MAG: hypothetical protein AAF752_04970 [Bacteroidota bacterium]